ncbi:hypothetical protein [Aminobacterium sp. UBA5514]|uniref:hypothetical protein n=2 Tax=Aminobacterium TaxID=81466 RepID=UPI00257F7A99|nr:hypothetical protein [Aminobacterium sp. UBA5514]
MDKQSTEILEIVFHKIGHFWQDSGLIGFKNILSKINEENDHKISIKLDEDHFVVSGTQKDIQESLNKSYDALINEYYNISTELQKQDKEKYNFYYDNRKDDFYMFPKRKARGIAWLIFDQPPKASAQQVKWKNKTKHILPEEYSHLQKRLDSFIEQNNLTNITSSAMLIDGPNEVKPTLDLDISKPQNKKRYECCICGAPAANCYEVGSTILPLLTGASGGLSFNSNGGSPEKACWKCALLGKFVPVNGFYYRSKNSLFTFFPYSSSLKKMDEIYPAMNATKSTDPNYNQNFDTSLGTYFQKSFEVAFAFFYTLYSKLVKEGNNNTSIREDLDNLYGIDILDTNVNFYILTATHTGSTFAIKSLWLFQDTLYIFKLFNALEQQVSIDMKEFMRLLIDYDAQNDGMTLYRNRICERILKKKSVLDLLEQYVYHSNRNKKTGYIKPLFDFLMFYEANIGGKEKMTSEEQSAAVTLGKRIGYAIGKEEDGRKSDLYTLRRTKSRVAFLEQLNRLQFRMGGTLTIPPEIYEGSLSNKNFKEFKQFCMIAALNSFFAAKSNIKKGAE